jgi:hypothetical protein
MVTRKKYIYYLVLKTVRFEEEQLLAEFDRRIGLGSLEPCRDCIRCTCFASTNKSLYSFKKKKQQQQQQITTNVPLNKVHYTSPSMYLYITTSGLILNT